MELAQEDKDVLCHQLMFGGVEEGATNLKGMISAGVSNRDLYLDVLLPISAYLDTLWQEDRVSFVSVRVATLRIELLLKEIGRPESPIIVQQQKQAIFASLPDEEHTIGVKIAADLQRAKGWDVQLVTSAKYIDLFFEILHSPAEVLGLSISSSNVVHRLYTLVWALRSRRPGLKILVSGSLIANEARSFKYLDADAYASSFEEAELLLDGFVEQNSHAATSGLEATAY